MHCQIDDIDDMEVEATDLEHEIYDLIKSTSKSTREIVASVVRISKTKFAGHFYKTMLECPKAHFFLNNHNVENRLSQLLEVWLVDLFCTESISPRHIRQRQMEVGAVHARIRVPTSLILKGFRVLKQNILESLYDTRCTQDKIIESARFITSMIDICLAVMTTAYVHHTDRTIRNEEALRLFSITQDLRAERESQRASLAEWAQNAFLSTQLALGLEGVNSLRGSDFGLWFVHRAHLIFPKTREYLEISDAIGECDRLVLALHKKGGGETERETLVALKSKVDQISSTLNMLFNDADTEDSARDPVTKLYNQRFRNTIVSREIHIHKDNGSTFSLIAIEITNYNFLRSRMSQHEFNELIKRYSRVIIDNARNTDPIFRLSESKFLVLKVESGYDQALSYLRRLAERLKMEWPEQRQQQAQHSIFEYSIVVYDGHPDPRYVIRLSDQAPMTKLL